MDNLTHSLIGAALGQAGLKRKTGLAMPALIIAANLPDIDAGCAIYGIESLSMRRGLTHGPIALLVLPLVLAGALWWFDRWQHRRGKRPEGRLPIHFGWLLGLCTIGTLTHPLFDWFNNYGIRLLEPFSSQWFYGDTLFIIDIWILAALGTGIWLSLRRERDGFLPWTRPARIALGGVAVYVALNTGITFQAEAQGYHQLARDWDIRRADNRQLLVVANVGPMLFWRREMLWREGPFHGRGSYSLFQGVHWEEGMDRDIFPDINLRAAAQRDPAVLAFLFWARMPVVERDENGTAVLRDQRFMNPLTADQFSVTLEPKK